MSRCPLRPAMLIGLVLLAVGCAGNDGEGRPASRTRDGGPRNVLLVTIDTLRADHVGAYGAGNVATGNLDRLAREGTRFELTHAVTPVTLPSHASILTGLLPTRHGVRHNGLYRLDAGTVTLAERLSEHGMRTGAVVGAFVLDGKFGLDQGFDDYDDRISERKAQAGGFHERTADQVTDGALAWLERDEQPFFLWVHYYDPHASYSPPARFAERFAASAYDGEIAFVDEQLGRILDSLESSGRLDETLVVVTADHGESLGEHGEPTHSYTLYDASLRVPLIFRGPGVPAGRVVGGVTSIVDVTPTVLSAVGAGAIEDADGRDLTPHWPEGAPVPGDVAAYAETLATRLDHGWAALHSLRTPRHMYIDAPRPELYDSETDPDQLDNLLSHDPLSGDTRNARAELLGQLRGLLEQAVADEPGQLDEESLARLRSLGYAIASGPVAQTGTDPKDGLRWAAALSATSDMYHSGRRDQARRSLAELEAKLPTSGRLHQFQAQVAIDDGDFARALDHAERASALMPGSSYDRMMFAFILEQVGRIDDALKVYAEAARIDPDVARVQLGLMRAAARAGSIEEAERHARRVRELIEAGDTWVKLWEIGERWQEISQFERAFRAYQPALAQTPDSERMHMLYAITLVQVGRGEQAPTHLARAGETAKIPNLANLLGMAYAMKGQMGPAESTFREILAAHPDFGPARANFVRLLQMTGRADEAKALLGS